MKTFNYVSKKMLDKAGKTAARLAAVSVLGVSAANAALPTVIGTTLTAVQTDGLALIDLVWPVIGAITGGFILFKLFKRGASKI